MSIPKEVLNKIRCCLFDDGHIVIEPVVLKCGANACIKCFDNSTVTKIKCFGCNETHKKNDLLNAAETDSEIVDSLIHSFLPDLFEDLKNKLETTAELLKSLFLLYVL
jgi:hypothetical protein